MSSFEIKKCGGCPAGPLTLDEVRALAASGSLAPDDLVRPTGDSSWRWAWEARGLFPPEAIKRCRQPGGGSVAADNLSAIRVRQKNGMDVGSFSPKELKLIAVEGRLAPDDLVQLEGTRDWRPALTICGLFREASPAENHPSQANPQLRYWMKRSGRETEGPLTVAQIQSIAESGYLSPDDLIRTTTSPRWERAGKSKELFSPELLRQYSRMKASRASAPEGGSVRTRTSATSPRNAISLLLGLLFLGAVSAIGYIGHAKYKERQVTAARAAEQLVKEQTAAREFDDLLKRTAATIEINMRAIKQTQHASSDASKALATLDTLDNLWANAITTAHHALPSLDSLSQFIKEAQAQRAPLPSDSADAEARSAALAALRAGIDVATRERAELKTARATAVKLIAERATQGIGSPGEQNSAATAGDAASQFRLGVQYYSGDGVPKNTAKAAEFLAAAAKQGHVQAQRLLGALCLLGEGVPRDTQQAAKWLTLAAQNGNAEAQFTLGGMYHNGEGVSQSYRDAVKWFRMAAEQGHAAAQFNLGVYYFTGEGVPQDVAKAVELYHKAANGGLADAQYALGVMYYNGEGVGRSVAEACVWFRMAANQGHAGAQQTLRTINETQRQQPQTIACSRCGGSGHLRWDELTAQEQRALLGPLLNDPTTRSRRLQPACPDCGGTGKRR